MNDVRALEVDAYGPRFPRSEGGAARCGRSGRPWLVVGVLICTCVLLAGCVTHGPAGVVESPVVVEASLPTYGESAAIDALAQAIDARLAAMQSVAAAKWLSGAPIEDPTREAAVVGQMVERGSALGLDTATVGDLFRTQIELARNVQQRYHDAWRKEGRCTPCARAQALAATRAQLESLGTQELDALYVVLPANASATIQGELRERIAGISRRHELAAADRDALLAAVVGVSRMPDTASLLRMRASGQLRIGTSGDYAPFSREAASGRLAGSDIELATELAAALGLRPIFMRTSWATLSDDMRADKFDVAIGGVSPSPEREAVGRFSLAYHEGGKTIVARCADRARYRTEADVDRPGVRVVVNPGGTNERYVRAHLHVATIIVHPDNRTIFDELLARHEDVMITDDVEADLQVLSHPGQLCRTTEQTLTRGEKRIFMAPDPGLQAAVDAWLVRAIAAGTPALRLQEAMHRFAAEADRRH